MQYQSSSSSSTSSYSSEDEEPKTPEKQKKTIDSLSVFDCLVTPSPGSQTKTSFEATRNARSVSGDIDRVLLQQLATVDPRSRTIVKLVKDKPDIFINTTYEKTRQRFKYLFNKRNNESDTFFELCKHHSIPVSTEVRIAILEDNVASSATTKKKTTLKSSLKKNTPVKNNKSESFNPTCQLTSSFLDSPTVSSFSSRSTTFAPKKGLSSSTETIMAQQMLEARMKQQAMRVGELTFDEEYYLDLKDPLTKGPTDGTLAIRGDLVVHDGNLVDAVAFLQPTTGVFKDVEGKNIPKAWVSEDGRAIIMEKCKHSLQFFGENGKPEDTGPIWTQEEDGIDVNINIVSSHLVHCHRFLEIGQENMKKVVVYHFPPGITVKPDPFNPVTRDRELNVKVHYLATGGGLVDKAGKVIQHLNPHLQFIVCIEGAVRVVQKKKVKDKTIDSLSLFRMSSCNSSVSSITVERPDPPEEEHVEIHSTDLNIAVIDDIIQENMEFEMDFEEMNSNTVAKNSDHSFSLDRYMDNNASPLSEKSVVATANGTTLNVENGWENDKDLLDDLLRDTEEDLKNLNQNMIPIVLQPDTAVDEEPNYEYTNNKKYRRLDGSTNLMNMID